MNIAELNTPSDLAEANTLTPLEVAVKACEDLSYSESRELVDLLLEAALDFHKAEGMDAANEGNTKKLVAFTLDVARLQDAVTLLGKVS